MELAYVEDWVGGQAFRRVYLIIEVLMITVPRMLMVVFAKICWPNVQSIASTTRSGEHM